LRTTPAQGLSPRSLCGMLSGMTVGEVLKLLKSDGWYRVQARGGHRQFKHPTKPGRVTVSGKASHDLPLPSTPS
jgi:predicted RNA binding protein YcfA (HicA-like mRNA interferase family)